ncbi:MAG: anthranilate synthase/aminodeoxychorismate synthase-like glutamine amidotransferase [Planctomycetota bacterium]
MILLVDNYDSFTFNLVQSLEVAGAEVVVRRNDEVEASFLSEWKLEALVISPGPGNPDGAGRCLELLAQCPPGLPVLGVCLGHQVIVQHYGGTLEFDPEPVHGRATNIFHHGTDLFADLPVPMEAGRYHSIRAAELPAVLKRTAWTESDEIMAVAHESAPHFGIQFHPESILTPHGDALIENFLRLARSMPVDLEP